METYLDLCHARALVTSCSITIVIVMSFFLINVHFIVGRDFLEDLLVRGEQNRLQREELFHERLGEGERDELRHRPMGRWSH